MVHKANTRRQIDPTPNLLFYLKTSVYMLSIFTPQRMDCYANLTMPYVFPLTQFPCVECQLASIYPPISVREIVDYGARNFFFSFNGICIYCHF